VGAVCPLAKAKEVAEIRLARAPEMGLARAAETVAAVAETAADMVMAMVMAMGAMMSAAMKMTGMALALLSAPNREGYCAMVAATVTR